MNAQFRHSCVDIDHACDHRECSPLGRGTYNGYQLAILVYCSLGMLDSMSLVVADTLDARAEIHFAPEYHDAANSSPFWLPKNAGVFPSRRGRIELELNLHWHGVRSVATVGQNAADGTLPETRVLVNELYWEGEFLAQDLSLGKKIRTGGVGFGYRPLDVIQRENRRRLYPSTLEGVTALAWQHFGSEDAWSVIYANPGRGRDGSIARNDESLIGTYYGLHGATDVHALFRLSERQRIELGAGFTRVLSDQLEVHGSFLYQDRGERRVNSLIDTQAVLAMSDPMRLETVDRPVKALLGVTWTGENGWSVLAEAWHDGEAYTVRNWRDLAILTRSQSALSGTTVAPESAVNANISASSRAFEPVNLLRWNTLLRISHDGSRLDPFLEFLYTPEDSGFVATLGADYTMDSHRIGLRLRVLGGPSEAAYSLLPESWMILAFWEWHLF